MCKNFAKFTGKHLFQSPYFNKLAGLSTATLLKKSLWHRCFPVNFAKFLHIFYGTRPGNCFCFAKFDTVFFLRPFENVDERFEIPTLKIK